jgi:hypothetical protein
MLGHLTRANQCPELTTVIEEPPSSRFDDLLGDEGILEPHSQKPPDSYTLVVLLLTYLFLRPEDLGYIWLSHLACAVGNSPPSLFYLSIYKQMLLVDCLMTGWYSVYIFLRVHIKNIWSRGPEKWLPVSGMQRP